MILRFGHFELDETACELRERGEPRHLEPKVFDLLLFLARNRERMVGKRELMDAVWVDVAVSESSLTRAISLARTAVGDTGHDQRVIRTLSGRGYRFVADVEEGSPPGSRAPARARRWPVAAAAVMAGALVFWWSWPAPMAAFLDLAGLRPPPVAPPLPDRPSVAVLPFENESGASSALLVDGFTDDLTSELGYFSELFVIARSSAFAVRGLRIGDIAHELGVRYVVEGSVRSDGDRIVVSARLTEAEGERETWSRRYDRSAADLWSLQAEIAREIAGSLGVSIRTAERARIRDLAESDLNVYELVLRGLAHFRQLTREELVQAGALFEEAAARDPGYARAHALLASTVLANVVMGWDPDPRHVERGRRLAERALQLDPQLPTAHTAMAAALLSSGDSAGAAEMARRAVELGPNSDMCHGVRAMALAAEGDATGAISALNQALRLNPLHPAPYWMLLGYMYQRSGRSDRAIEIWERVRLANLDMILPRLELAKAYADDGRVEDARELISEILATSPGFSGEDAVRIDPRDPQGQAAADLRASLEALGLPQT